ncbi:DUF4262 domain-containing protein [Kitasatospora sp. NPDC058032]|uniref:DUF4262 domain-containing protein n=1 Tax=Kitasatospora sp. NPDC058032 TaxID=3346307 RepID=UPI0036DD7E38
MTTPPAPATTAVCPCVICAAEETKRSGSIRSLLRRPGGAPRVSRRWKRAAGDVLTHGHHVVGVGGGGSVPDWAFTVGRWHTDRLPELAMFGLDAYGQMNWLNEAVARLREGASAEPDSLLTGVIDGYPLLVRPVDAGWLRPLLGTAVGFYRRAAVPVLQLLWPDRNHRWPWDPEASPGCRAQPRLWLPVAAHPEGVWTEEAASAEADAAP